MQKTVPATIQLTAEELEAMINKAVSSAVSRAVGAKDAKWITRQEAADITRLSLRTIDAKIAAGTYRITKAGSAKTSPIRILASDVVLDQDRHQTIRRAGVPFQAS